MAGNRQRISCSKLGSGGAAVLLFAASLLWADTAPTGPSSEVLKKRSIEIILQASSGKDPALRSNAIEAMQALPDRALPLTTKGLEDENPGVRFAAAVTAGMLKFRDLSPALRPLLRDENPSVRAAALYAMYTLGEKVDISPLGDMLASQDPVLCSNTALLLGLLGDGSAVPMLKAAARHDLPRVSEAQKTIIRLQIAEAVSRLGDNGSLDALRAGVFSQYHEAKMLAITALGEVKDRSMEAALENMISRPDVDPVPKGADSQTLALSERLKSELRLAAAGALARFGNMRGAALAVEKGADKEPVVRAQAAWVMGWMNDQPSLGRLGQLLDDPVPQVRVAAAAGVLKRQKK